MSKNKKKKKDWNIPNGATPQPDGSIECRPVRAYRIAFLMMTVVGFLLSLDLMRLHVNVHTDPNYHSYCAMSEHVNCEAVATSDWAVFAGMPVAAWGLIIYLAFGIFALWGLRRRLPAISWPFGFLLLGSVVASIGSFFFFYVSHYIIHSLCIVCIGTYLVNLALVVIAILGIRKLGASPLAAISEEVQAVIRRPLPFAGAIGSFSLLIVLGVLFYPPYWETKAGKTNTKLATGFTEEGHPWIGASEPKLTIHEYSDYECPHCRHGHDAVRQLVEKNPDTLRLIHYHYPLDDACNDSLKQPFHANACSYSYLALCGGLQNKFWEANDYLFASARRRTPVMPGELAAKVGLDAAALQECYEGDMVYEKVVEDLKAGQALNIRGTPSFVVNGRVYPGRIPPEALEDLK